LILSAAVETTFTGRSFSWIASIVSDISSRVCSMSRRMARVCAVTSASPALASYSPPPA
jgi:hypothetical protein